MTYNYTYLEIHNLYCMNRKSTQLLVDVISRNRITADNHLLLHRLGGATLRCSFGEATT